MLCHDPSRRGHHPASGPPVNQRVVASVFSQKAQVCSFGPARPLWPGYTIGRSRILLQREPAAGRSAQLRLDEDALPDLRGDEAGTISHVARHRLKYPSEHPPSVVREHYPLDIHRAVQDAENPADKPGRRWPDRPRATAGAAPTSPRNLTGHYGLSMDREGGLEARASELPDDLEDARVVGGLPDHAAQV